MRSATKLLLLAAALAVALGLAACGGDSDDGDTVSGAFELTGEAPATYDGLEGEADLTRADGATTVAIDLAGLEPDTEYMSHLHIGGCAAPEVGGPHFKFDAEGSDQPPNEIHMMFESDADGDGAAEAESDREVPAGEAGSVVVHLAAEAKMTASHDREGAHEHPDKIACAELEGLSPEAEEAAEEADAMKHDEDAMEHGDSMEHGDDGDAMKHGDSTEIAIVEGEPVGGIAELEYSAGEEVRFTVESDAAEEIHVHGYDISKQVPAGGSVSFSFPAEIEGIFEVEMEELGVQIAELQVNP